MNAVLNRIATPFTITLFIVSAISGAALFFHWNGRLFHEMHEWLSMVFLAPVALHLIRNWKSLTGYLARGGIVIPLLITAAAAAVFVFPRENERRGPPVAARAVGALTHAHVSELAPVIGMAPAALQTRLADLGYTAAPEDTLATIAARKGVPAQKLLGDVLPSPAGEGRDEGR